MGAVLRAYLGVKTSVKRPGVSAESAPVLPRQVTLEELDRIVANERAFAANSRKVN